MVCEMLSTQWSIQDKAVTNLDLLILIILIHCVDGLLHLAKHQVAMAVVSLGT